MITKSELIEYLKHTPENTNYNILRSALYNGSNKEIVDEFIEVLSYGNLSLAALQPHLAKLYEDDKTISPEPLPPFSVRGSPNAVLYTTQTLTDDQKKQARDNINAASVFIVNGAPNQSGTVTLDKTLVQINEAANSGKNVFARITLGNFIAFMPLTQHESNIVKFAMAGNDNANVVAAELVVTPNVNSLHINRSPGLNNNLDMSQISMASDPVSPMQIATKQYVDDHATGGTGGGSPNAVLYTEQTLTDEQKKQARENINAAGEFVINATITSDKQSATLDKTFAQIQESISAGKTPIVLMNNMSYLTILDVDTDYIAFMATTVNNRTASFVTLYVYPDQEPQLSILDTVILTPDYNMPQVQMDSDPTEPMEIATKKYVVDALDGKAGTAVATMSANGLMSKDDKAKLNDITGQVTAANIHAPEHTTDLVQYGAFQIAAQQIISQIPTVPDVLPNPKALVIKIGSTTVTYDGSTAKTVEIADGSEVSY